MNRSKLTINLPLSRSVIELKIPDNVDVIHTDCTEYYNPRSGYRRVKLSIVASVHLPAFSVWCVL
jgi:hypothetical protein